MTARLICFLVLVFGAATYGQEAVCEAYFTPKDRLADRLIQLIDREDASVRMAVYQFTHLGIAKALIRAHKRGVRIEVLVDPVSIVKKSSIHRLIAADVPVFVWDEQLWRGERIKRRSKMHDAFAIFGEELVWTGSFHFTNDASRRHRENAVTLASTTVAKDFTNEFYEMKVQEARPFAEYATLYQKRGPKG